MLAYVKCMKTYMGIRCVQRAATISVAIMTVIIYCHFLLYLVFRNPTGFRGKSTEPYKHGPWLCEVSVL